MPLSDTTDKHLGVKLLFQAGEHHHKALIHVPDALVPRDAHTETFQYALIDIWQHQPNWFGSTPVNPHSTSPATRLEDMGITNTLYQVGDSAWLHFS